MKIEIEVKIPMCTTLQLEPNIFGEKEINISTLTRAQIGEIAEEFAINLVREWEQAVYKGSMKPVPDKIKNTKRKARPKAKPKAKPKFNPNEELFEEGLIPIELSPSYFEEIISRVTSTELILIKLALFRIENGSIFVNKSDFYDYLGAVKIGAHQFGRAIVNYKKKEFIFEDNGYNISITKDGYKEAVKIIKKYRGEENEKTS